MNERLGTKGGVEAVISHPFFDDIDMDLLLSKKMEPPFIPEIDEDKYGTKNFDDEVTN